MWILGLKGLATRSHPPPPPDPIPHLLPSKIDFMDEIRSQKVPKHNFIVDVIEFAYKHCLSSPLDIFSFSALSKHVSFYFIQQFVNNARFNTTTRK